MACVAGRKFAFVISHLPKRAVGVIAKSLTAQNAIWPFLQPAKLHRVGLLCNLILVTQLTRCYPAN